MERERRSRVSDPPIHPIDDGRADLASAVSSLSDKELRELLDALLREWRGRCEEAAPRYS